MSVIGVQQTDVALELNSEGKGSLEKKIKIFICMIMNPLPPFVHFLTSIDFMNPIRRNNNIFVGK